MLFGLDALTLVLGPERVVASLLTRLLARGFYDLTNRISHKLRLLLMYVMAAVRVRNVPGTRHLASTTATVAASNIIFLDTISSLSCLRAFHWIVAHLPEGARSPASPL